IDVRQNQNRSSLPWVPLPSTCGCCGRRAWRKHRSMDFELPEELRLLKATLRRFVDNELIPIERKSTDGEQIKPDYLKRFEDRATELGLWHLDVPTEYGGMGMFVLGLLVLGVGRSRTSDADTPGADGI